MHLLNSKSILVCDEEEEALHLYEIEKCLNQLTLYPNYDCAVVIKYFDVANKKREPVILSCKLHECDTFLENVDNKNGYDIGCVDGFLTFIVYGQTYEYLDKIHIVTSAIQIRPFNKEKEFIYLSLITN